MTSQLAIMMRAGVDMASALESLARQCASPTFQSILEDVHASVLGGNSVSDAMAQIWPRIRRNLCRKHCRWGGLGTAARSVKSNWPNYFAMTSRLRNSVRTMLAYPILLSTISGIVVLALILFVLPKFAEIFADFDAALPADHPVFDLDVDRNSELASGCGDH